MSRCLRRLAGLVVVLTLGVLGLPGAALAAQASCPDAGLEPNATNVSRVKAATLCLLNAERTRRGLRALRVHRALQAVGQTYAEQLVRERFFAHVSPDGTTPLGRIRDRTGYLRGASSWRVGENLAWGSGRLATARERMRDWMASPPHRRNILRRAYRHAGIGIAMGAPVGTGRRGAATYATEFGARSRQ